MNKMDEKRGFQWITRICTKIYKNKWNHKTENTILKIKNSMHRFDSRLEITEERISKLKDKLIENIRTEASREKKDGTKCKAHGEKGQIILRM